MTFKCILWRLAALSICLFRSLSLRFLFSLYRQSLQYWSDWSIELSCNTESQLPHITLYSKFQDVFSQRSQSSVLQKIDYKECSSGSCFAINQSGHILWVLVAKALISVGTMEIHYDQMNVASKHWWFMLWTPPMDHSNVSWTSVRWAVYINILDTNVTASSLRGWVI